MSLCLNPDCLSSNLDGDKFCQQCRSKLLLQERYQALKLIGQGGFGKTFKAVDLGKPSKPYCVIKQFFPSAQGTDSLEKASQLFEQEAIQLDNLGKHPQIPELFAYLTHEDQRQYLVQEYIEGQNLEQELKSEGAFNEDKIKALLMDILPVLEFIHSQGVIHRDIKPENIIRRASDQKAVLVDFGASKVVTQVNRSVTGTVIGSAEYVAPEQANGKACNASDLYSLGVTCLYLLTQVSPFDLFDISEHEWVWREFFVNNSVSDELGKIIDKLIQFGTRKRYQSASEVLKDLIGKLEPIQTPVTPVIQTPPPPVIEPSSPSVIQVPLPSQSHPNFAIKITKNIDYSKLEQLLQQQKWKEADQETYVCMMMAVGRKIGDYLRKEDIDNFPCEDLRTIDQLWVKYSKGHFGFSVQKKIWLEVGGKVDYKTEQKLGDRTGWHKEGKWMSYYSLQFNLSAPSGHLPVRFAVGVGLWGWVSVWSCGCSALAQRLVSFDAPVAKSEGFTG